MIATHQQLMVTIRDKYQIMNPYLNERSRRIWAANEARVIGRDGRTILHQATGIDFKTIQKGYQELQQDPTQRQDMRRIRTAGGGRKQNASQDTALVADIETLVAPATRGDPEQPLKWCSKSTRHIADELNTKKPRASHALVARILTTTLGFSLQANRKTDEGGRNNPDRNQQFEFINDKVIKFQKKHCPILSVDTKKKENIGNFKNHGQEYHQKGRPEEVKVYDFIDTTKGKIAPYGVYDLSKNQGWVAVGISSDTAAFAVNSIRGWWYDIGKDTYREASDILITADCGGSNGYRVRLWKVELQKLATEINKVIHVSHFPPGTSKWNKIEHKLFCFISKNWRGKPLLDRATVINLIGNTTTKKGLTVKARLDEHTYEKGIKVSDEELAAVKLVRNESHGEWNYWIKP